MILLFLVEFLGGAPGGNPGGDVGDIFIVSIGKVHHTVTKTFRDARFHFLHSTTHSLPCSN